MTSTNTALAAAGYTKAPSPFFGCREILKDGASVGHFDCQTAWSLPGMREVEDRIAAEDLAAATLEAGVIALASRAAVSPHFAGAAYPA